MTKREIIKILDSNVRRLRRQLKEARRSERERLVSRLEEAERIRDAIQCQERNDRRVERLNNLL